jgi:alkanesulfonate monooxygenase SsuD/methylene tetrahydromethanopterin reductase-like flavin-dependent oxidoreductase (luciferase family)
MTDFFVGLQIWGTPDQVTEKIVDLQDHTHMEGYMGVFSYAGMPIEEADRNMKLFAKEVMPGLQAMAPAAERLGMPA